ncbi:RNA polymerase sigma factor [Planctomycetota bacterium]
MSEKQESAVLQANKKHLQSFEKCFRVYGDTVFALIYNLIGRRAEAEEITQDVFLAYLKYLLKRGEVKSAADFIFKSARNRALDYARKQKRRDEIFRETFFNRNQDNNPAEEPEPELVARLNNAVATLPPEQKEVLLLKIYGRQQFKGIAGICGIPLKTAISRYQYALAKLRKILEHNHEK